MKRKILISGATGYIGQNFIKKNSNDYDIFCLVRHTSNYDCLLKYVPSSNIIIIKNDKKLYKDILQIRPEIYIHLAGVFLSEHNEDNLRDMLECNIDISAIILDAVVNSGCKKVINTETYWMNYSGKSYNPVNLYAATKKAFEDILIFYVEAKDISVINLKLFDTYGPNDNRPKLLNVLKHMDDKSEIDLSSCEQKVYYVYIDDIVSAFKRAIEIMDEDAGTYIKTYEVREDKPYILKEIVELFVKDLGKNIKLNYGKRASREREIQDPTSFEKVLPGWKCNIKLVDGLLKMMEDE